MPKSPPVAEVEPQANASSAKQPKKVKKDEETQPEKSSSSKGLSITEKKTKNAPEVDSNPTSKRSSKSGPAEAEQRPKSSKNVKLANPGSGEELPVYRVNNAGLYRATFYSNLGSFFFGIAMGWTGGAEESVMQRSTYGYTPSKLQWNYVCVLLTLGALVWCLPTGFLLRWCGCKRTILVQLLPNTLGWCLTVWGQDIHMLYAARFILGMCGGAHCVAVPIYSAEISSIRKRGIMGVCFYGACIVGMAYSIVMSSFLNIRLINIINLILLLICLLQFRMPESPAYYLKRRKFERAEDSLRWLRGKNHNVSKEIEFLTKSPSQSEHNQQQHPYQGFKYAKVRRSLFRVLVLAVFHKLCGAYVFILYSYELVACLKLPKYLVPALVVPALVGYLVCMFLVERVGRKHLLVVCSAIMFFATVIIGIGYKLFLENGGDILPWVTYFCIPIYVGAYTTGLGTLTWLLTVELVSPPMRPLVCSIAATTSWLCASMAIFWYSSIKVVCQPYLFLLFAIVSVLSLLFTLAYIPETKGLPTSRILRRMGKQKAVPDGDTSDESDAEVYY